MENNFGSNRKSEKRGPDVPQRKAPTFESRLDFEPNYVNWTDQGQQEQSFPVPLDPQGNVGLPFDFLIEGGDIQNFNQPQMSPETDQTVQQNPVDLTFFLNNAPMTDEFERFFQEANPQVYQQEISLQQNPLQDFTTENLVPTSNIDSPDLYPSAMSQTSVQGMPFLSTFSQPSSFSQQPSLPIQPQIRLMSQGINYQNAPPLPPSFQGFGDGVLPRSISTQIIEIPTNDQINDQTALTLENPSKKIEKRGKITSIACQVCRKKHVKCDGNQPCATCKKSRAECSYSLKRNFGQCQKKFLFLSEFSFILEQVDIQQDLHVSFFNNNIA